MAKRKKTYTAKPSIPENRAALVRAILDVQAGATTVTAAAEKLGMSRVHFQTLMNRGLTAMVEAVAPQPPGRPPKPAREAELEQQLAEVKGELSRLKTTHEISDRLMKLAGEVIRGERTLKMKAPKGTDDDGGDPGQRLAAVLEMRFGGMSAKEAAASAGVPQSTMRRWAARDRRQEPLVERRGPGEATHVTPEQRAQIEALVRATNGQIGADALRHMVKGVSRRPAAAIKRDVLQQVERERRAACTRIRVNLPGVLRGFDQIEQRAPATFGYLLRCSDGSVPYTTSMVVAARYDARSVMDALERDWDANGAPYVLRLDRGAMHMVEPLRDLADARGVLLLHGPAYRPQFYGQLERENQHVRAVLAGLGATTAMAAAARMGEILAVLNERWPRRSLGFHTPAERWQVRPQLAVDRTALRAEVADRADRLRWKDGIRGGPADHTERLAIEEALITRGWMSREPGGWC